MLPQCAATPKAGLFFPTGTLAQRAAIHAHFQDLAVQGLPQGRLILHPTSHLIHHDCLRDGPWMNFGNLLTYFEIFWRFLMLSLIAWTGPSQVEKDGKRYITAPSPESTRMYKGKPIRENKYKAISWWIQFSLPLGASQSKRARLEIDRLPALNVQVVGRFERPFQREDFPSGCPGAGDVAAHLLTSWVLDLLGSFSFLQAPVWPTNIPRIIWALTLAVEQNLGDKENDKL